MKLAHVPIHLKRESFFVENSMKPLDLQRVKNEYDQERIDRLYPQQSPSSADPIACSVDLIYRDIARMASLTSLAAKLSVFI